MNKTHYNKQPNTTSEDGQLTSEMVKSTWASMGHFLHHLDPDIRKITRRLEHLYLKILRRKQSRVFNQTFFDMYIYAHGEIVSHRKRRWQPVYTSCMTLFAFHIEQIPLGKV